MSRIVITSHTLDQEELLTIVAGAFTIVAMFRTSEQADDYSVKVPACFIIESKKRWYVCQSIHRENT